MRTVQLTFTFTEDEWDLLRGSAILDGKQPTWGEVTNQIKTLALDHARMLKNIGEDLDDMENSK